MGAKKAFIVEDKWVVISNDYLKYSLSEGDALDVVLDTLFRELEKQGKEIAKLKKLV